LQLVEQDGEKSRMEIINVDMSNEKIVMIRKLSSVDLNHILSNSNPTAVKFNDCDAGISCLSDTIESTGLFGPEATVYQLLLCEKCGYKGVTK